MKKTLPVTALVLLLSVLLLSCTTSGDYHEQMLPNYFVSFTDFSSDQYEFLGNVTGTSSFILEGDLSDVYAYTGMLDLYDTSDALYDADIEAAFRNASYNMTRKAREMNANMLILPS